MAKCCLALLILSIIAYATTRDNFLLETPSKIVKFVCDLAKDFVENDKNVKTIAIVRFKTEIPEQFMSEVGQCMSKDVSLIVADLKQKTVPLSFFKPSLVILITNEAERVKIIIFLNLTLKTNFLKLHYQI